MFAGAGFLLAVPIAYRILRFAWLYFLRPSSLSRYLLPNAYGLVTGASDGIGRAIAHELAARGFNVVLHGRNQIKLDAVQASIQAAHPTRKVRTVIADATASGTDLHGAVAAIAKELETNLDGPLTVLYHNCGGTQPQRYAYLTLREMHATEIDEMINLNARFHVQLTRALLPLLEKEVEGGSGKQPALIMHNGSMAGAVAMPYLTTYAAGKVYGNSFFVALGREMKLTNPRIETISVLVAQVTDTAYFSLDPSLFKPSSRHFAKSVLDRVGCGQRGRRPLVACSTSGVSGNGSGVVADGICRERAAKAGRKRQENVLVVRTNMKHCICFD